MPTALFVILSLIFVVPLVPADWPALAVFKFLDAQWQVIAISFLTIVLTGLLYNLNTPIIRFYEGYPWKDSWIGRWRTQRYENECAALNARFKGMRTLLIALDETHPNYPSILKEWRQVSDRINTDFPKKVDLVLPTQLGNVMRSYEYYPDEQYGIEAITLWPRLIDKIDDKYALALDDAKASFDFMINSSVLSILLALTILIVGLLYPTLLISVWQWQLWVPWAIAIVGYIGLSFLFYQGAIVRAKARGALVKGAFDLYRWALLDQLGYKRDLTTRKEERALWNNISLQMLYGDGRKEPRVEYAIVPPPTLSTSASASPDTIALEITRGMKPSDGSGAITIVLQVTNVDSQNRPAEKIVVTDTLPEGLAYEWGSAHVANRKVCVVGVNPYQFHIEGHLENSAKDVQHATNNDILLTYRAIPQNSACGCYNMIAKPVGQIEASPGSQR